MAALVIPILALVVFFTVALPRAQARPEGGSCGGSEVYAPCPNNGCNNGMGSCVPNDGAGFFIFCRDFDGGQPPGPGRCADNCVTCTYGEY